VRQLHRPLLGTAILMTALALISFVGVLLDDRTLLGAPIWLKPLKFSISLAVYALTISWLLSHVTRGARTAWWLGVVIAAASVLEQAVIVWQVLRGRASHFNVMTPLDSMLWSTMGVMIILLWVTTAYIAVLLLRQRLADRADALAIRLGLLIALGGLAIGFLMTNPTAEQLAGMATAPPTVIGAHAVGVADGGPGLPLVGWSTEGGDLRAGHFIGMHALQALPLLALLLNRLRRRGVRRLADPRLRASIIGVAGFGYAGLTALVTWQALRGQSLIHPDRLTWGAAGVLTGLTLAGLALAGVRASGSASPAEPVAPSQPAAPAPVNGQPVNA
jgi:hypothetical protein